ncbi:MAG: DUF2786 domain-containing protein [Streptosporangiaceae bacterium]
MTDQRMLQKIRALLAKAESTDYPEEAEALSTRAQELMARHSIDRALLDAAAGSRESPAGRRVPVASPYEMPKATLLHVVAEANRCRSVWHRDLGASTVFGFPADLEAVEMMYTSLLVQATGAMLRSGSRHDEYGRSRTRSFRQSFLSAYAGRIGERLRAATRAAVEEASAGTGLLPVLATRDKAVEQAVTEVFPRLRRFANSVTNRDGYEAGRAAADRAALGHHAEVRSPG